MESLEIVLNEYIASSTELVGGRLRRKRVPNDPPSDAELEIRTNLPAILSAEIERTGRNINDYRVYGSVGQINFPFARIPWVAALHREITTSTERGYYIVLLFQPKADFYASFIRPGSNSLPDLMS
jgi:5-methylcytosine-specific restriction protein A